MGEIWRGAELLIYNGEIFSAANLPLKLPNILITFWNSEILKGSVLHGYNEGLFYGRFPVKFSKRSNFFGRVSVLGDLSY